MNILYVTGRPSSAAIIRAGQKNTKQNTNTFHKIYENFTIVTQTFDWFSRSWSVTCQPGLTWDHGETIQMISYTFKPKMVHRTPQDHCNSSTAYSLHFT